MLGRHVNYLFLIVLLLLSAAATAAPAPRFKLSTGKSSIELSAYRGKIVYVDFWASWCGPCRKSFPWMTELQKRYKGDLKVIAINLDQERTEAIKFLNQFRPGFTVAFDPQGKVAEAYNVPGMPTSYLIDRSGQIVSKHVGFRSKEKEAVEHNIQSLISRRQARVN